MVDLHRVLTERRPRVPVALHRASEACASPKATGPLAKAVDKAIQDAALPLLLAQPEDLGFEPESNLPLIDATVKWRAACLASNLVLRPILFFLPAALAEQGLTCEGCPSTADSPLRRVTWNDLAPYVGAYFWPNPVRTPLGPNGVPSGEPEYGYHICVGINGLEGPGHLDPELARAGLIVAKGSSGLQAAARGHFRSILDGDEFRGMDNDEARTTYLRRHLPAAVAGDPTARRAACDLLGRFSKAVGVTLDDCGALGHLTEHRRPNIAGSGSGSRTRSARRADPSGRSRDILPAHARAPRRPRAIGRAISSSVGSPPLPALLALRAGLEALRFGDHAILV